MLELYKNCVLCPRRCGVDRTVTHGACGMGAEVYAARAALHMWEEPCISGDEPDTGASCRYGSGTVFFVGCSLGCVFCQNRSISHGEGGRPLSADGLADAFLRLQDDKLANNINLVTATHFTPTVAAALEKAKKRGLFIPVVWNSGGYELVETLCMLDGLVDIYLPDLKYVSPELSARYSHAPDYFEAARGALDEMYRQVGEPRFSEGGELPEGIMTRGMIVRHLILPTHADDSREVIKYLHGRFGDSIFISIMNQYTPVGSLQYPELYGTVTEAEYDSVVDCAVELGVKNGFIQEGGAVGESFIPAFDGEGLQ